MMFDLYLKRPRGVDLCERECERVSATVAATVADEVVRGEVSAGRTWKFVAPCGLCRLRPAPLASGLPLWQLPSGFMPLGFRALSLASRGLSSSCGEQVAALLVHPVLSPDCEMSRKSSSTTAKIKKRFDESGAS